MSQDRCTACDRVDCPVPGATAAFDVAWAAWKQAWEEEATWPLTDEKLPRLDALCKATMDMAGPREVAKKDCVAHAVNWRTRAVAAEKALVDIRNISRDRERFVMLGARGWAAAECIADAALKAAGK